MIEKSDSKWISLAAASILGQAPSRNAIIEVRVSWQDTFRYCFQDWLQFASYKRFQVATDFLPCLGIRINPDPWVQGGCRVQDIGFTVESKNLSFTHRLNGHFLNRCGNKSLCSAPSWTHGSRIKLNPKLKINFGFDLIAVPQFDITH